MTVVTKQPSAELLSLIKAAAQSLLGFGELWNSIKKKGHDEGFSEKELQDILRPLLKPQLNKDQIYYLFNAEQKKEQSKEQYHRNITTNSPKKDIEQTPIPEELPPNAPTVTEEEFYKQQNQEPEEPTELELANIKIAQLEDALHKTEQFKPGTVFLGTKSEEEIKVIKDELAAGTTVIQSPQEYETEVFEWLRKRENHINMFFYDNYGIELITSRLIPQLKNAGVKTFKRLYFEV